MKSHYRSAMAGLAAVLIMQGIHCDADPLMTQQRGCTVTIRYRDTEESEDPIPGAVFSYYLVAAFSQEVHGSSVGVRWKSVLQGKNGGMKEISSSGNAAEIAEAAQSAYASGIPAGGAAGEMVTNTNGLASASGLPCGLYLIMETHPAKDHLPSLPFLLEVPYMETVKNGQSVSREWRYDVLAEPKPLPLGDLTVAKVVKGAGSGKNETFHFTVTLGTEGRYRWKRSDRAEGFIKSGETIALRGGQSAVISGIPVGCSFRIRENEADTGGYRTTASGTEGIIRRTRQARAIFTNTKPAATIIPTILAASHFSEKDGRQAKAVSVPQEETARRVLPVRTGDETFAGIWIAAAFVSLLAAVCIGLGIKKRGER